jgi:predicted nucleic acid-binding protein
MRTAVRVFLDTSALFAAIWSEAGGARMILKLGEAEAVQILIGKQVLVEIDAVLRQKHPAALPGLALLLDRCRVAVSEAADEEILARCLSLTQHAGDARVLAEAWCTGADYFMTHDQQHLSGNLAVLEGAPFPVGSAGDFLGWYRARLERG